MDKSWLSKPRGLADDEGNRTVSSGVSKTPFPFARAFNFLLADKHLCAAEKLVMVEICRYWPEPFYESAATIASHIGLNPRYVRNIITGLTQGTKTRERLGKPPRKCYLKRAYAHYKRNGQTLTVRVIKPLCFPTEIGARGEPHSARGQPGGRTPAATPAALGVRESARGQPPNRYLNRNKIEKEIESQPAPLPAKGQASAVLQDRQVEQQGAIEQSKARFGRPRKEYKPLTDAEFEQKRQMSRKQLLAGG
jgi:hypothetical protein